MKTSRSSNTGQSKQGMSHMPRPEIRDNLDSREKQEQIKKGAHTTHNKKEKKND